MADSPLVSVVVPTHNRAQLLRRAMDSVLGQTYSNLEIFVVDDASDDGTSEVLDTFDDPRVRTLRHDRNRGASAARNTGLSATNGDYIAFLDDDDEWLPTKLADQLPVLESAPPNVGMVYSWMDYFDAQGRRVGETHPVLRGNVFDQVIDKQRLGGCPTLLVRKSVIEDVGGFDEHLWRGNDGDFIRRVCLHYGVEVVPKVLVKVHVDHGPRLTDSSMNGLRLEAKALKIRLRKFDDQFRDRPKAHGIVLRQLGVIQGMLGQRASAWASFFKGALKDPRPRPVLLDGFRLAKTYIRRTKRSSRSVQGAA